MSSTRVDFSVLSRGIAGLVRATGLSYPTVVRKEMGALLSTLQRTTPPSQFAKRAKSKQMLEQKIELEVHRKFAGIGNEALSMDRLSGSPQTKSGLFLTGASSRFLFATAREANKRDASWREIAPLRFKIGKTGKQNLAFQHPRKLQKLRLSQTTLISPTAAKQVIKYAQSHIGRMKADWLSPVVAGRVKATGVPGWVMKHAGGGRGDYRDFTNNKAYPVFIVTNRAKGISERTIDFIVRTAVSIRAKAMVANALLFTKGKKRVSQYA